VNAIIVLALAAFAMFAYEHGYLVPNREQPSINPGHASDAPIKVQKCHGIADDSKDD
jgi:hypothetical protein